MTPTYLTWISEGTQYLFGLNCSRFQAGGDYSAIIGLSTNSCGVFHKGMVSFRNNVAPHPYRGSK